MSDSYSLLQDFRTMGAPELHNLLSARGILEDASLEAFIHALVDISESVEKVYGDVVPSMLNDSGLQNDDLKRKLWDIREEFRHITYHIEDAKLNEL